VRFLYRTANRKDFPQSIARIARTARKVLALQAYRVVATPMGDRPHMQTGR
jgi:hypothetical protein